MQKIGKVILCCLGLLLLLFPGWSEESPAGEQEFIFPSETKPLTDSEDVIRHIRYLRPASYTGLAAGVLLMIGGMITFSLGADAGYGSAEISRGITLLSAGTLLTAVSGTYLKATLATGNKF